MTTVNYNDGKWHGWNGGECPVHPETVLEVVLDDGSLVKGEFANRWFWGVDSTCIIALRVIKDRREPREFWAKEYKVLNLKSCMTVEMNGSRWHECSPSDTGATLFREVI